MNKYIEYIKSHPNSVSLKIITLVIFFLVLTCTDLIVKQVAYKTLKNKPDVVVVPGFWRFHYEINDDIGFSALRWVDRFFGVPKKIDADTFENDILKKYERDNYRRLIEQYYIKDTEGKYYILAEATGADEVRIIRRLLSVVGYRTSKWFFIVTLQASGAIAMIIFFFYSNFWRYLLPLAMIISGALGNVLDRIIRGYVIDYVMWTFKFIPLPIFNPWPIFNLADVYTVIGAILLIFIMFFFSKEDDELKSNL